MELVTRNGKSFIVREYIESDFSDVHRLNVSENWTNLVAKQEDTLEAWKHSNVRFVVFDQEKFVGYIRGVTDTSITLFICELLINEDYRGFGIGQELLKYVHNLYPKTRMELLGSSTSRTFYEQLGFRSFYGFRRTFEEIEIQ